MLYLLVYLVHICTCWYQELLNHLRAHNIIRLNIVWIFVVIGDSFSPKIFMVAPLYYYVLIVIFEALI